MILLRNGVSRCNCTYGLLRFFFSPSDWCDHGVLFLHGATQSHEPSLSNGLEEIRVQSSLRSNTDLILTFKLIRQFADFKLTWPKTYQKANQIGYILPLYEP